ncbi:MAG TPA: hypothetical protein VFG30_01010 [Polyangiales bacterium]|nr:hypothetical protein [Polyangiales bacterium]
MSRSEGASLMLMSQFDRVAIAVHDSVPPTDDEWERWMLFYQGRTEGRALIESYEGAGPNAKQRKALADRTQGIDLRAAILTDSLVVRGIVTAIAWLGIPQHAFPPGHFQQAGEFLGLTRDELSRAIEEINRLRSELHRATGGDQSR